MKQKISLKNNMLSFFDSRKNDSEYSNQEIEPTKRERSFLDYYSSNVFIQEPTNKNIPVVEKPTDNKNNDFIFRKKHKTKENREEKKQDSKSKNALDNNILHLENIENKLKSLTENNFKTINNIHNKTDHIHNKNNNTHKSYEEKIDNTINNIFKKNIDSPTLITNNNESVMNSINSMKNNTTKYVNDYVDNNVDQAPPKDEKHTESIKMIAKVIRVKGDNVPKIISPKYNVQNNRMKEYHTNDIGTTLISNIEKIVPKNEIIEIPTFAEGGVVTKPTIAQIGDAPGGDQTEVVMSPRKIPEVLAKANVIEKTNKLTISEQAKKSMGENSELKINQQQANPSTNQASQPALINAPKIINSSGNNSGGVQTQPSKSGAYLNSSSRLPRWRTQIG